MKAATFRKLAVHALAAFPLVGLLWQWSDLLLHNDPRAAGLTAEPVDYTINYLGLWAIRLLCLTLAVTPLRQVTRKNWVGLWRRPLGLWCFAYATLHLAVYFGLDMVGSFHLLWNDVRKHNFILFGMATWCLLLPLASTSTHRWIRRLGARNWQRLHRLIYGAAVLASIHFIMRVKGFQIEPWLYAAWLGAMLAVRLPAFRHKSANRPASA